MIEVNNILSNGLPNPFFRDVFIENSGFSESVRIGVENANLPNGIKNQIIQSDVNLVVGKNYVYEEFLDTYPSFNSLWTKRQLEEKNKLNSGMSPADLNFEPSFLTMEIEQLLFNDKNEIYRLLFI